MDPRQITRRAERTALGDPEPKLSVTEFTALLHAAAELERAGRPIVLHGPEAYPAPAGQGPPATHPGIDIGVPTAPAPAPEARNPWPIVFMVSACTAIGSCLVTSVTDSLVSMAVTLAAFAVWGLSTYNIVFKEQ